MEAGVSYEDRVARRKEEIESLQKAAKKRPVSKVITLLMDLCKQVDKEAEEDEDTSDKMAYWCETNDREKT